MGYAVIAIIIGVIIGIVLIVSKKDAKERDEMISKLTEEQKKFLMSTEVKFVEKNAWIQDAIVAKIKDNGNKINIRLLWYDTVIQNEECNTITIADTSISKSEQEVHNLKINDSVKIYIAPEKTIGSVKIVFN